MQKIRTEQVSITAQHSSTLTQTTPDIQPAFRKQPVRLIEHQSALLYHLRHLWVSLRISRLFLLAGMLKHFSCHPIFATRFKPLSVMSLLLSGRTRRLFSNVGFRVQHRRCLVPDDRVPCVAKDSATGNPSAGGDRYLPGLTNVLCPDDGLYIGPPVLPQLPTELIV
jgi:hypothetical protein